VLGCHPEYGLCGLFDLWGMSHVDSTTQLYGLGICGGKEQETNIRNALLCLLRCQQLRRAAQTYA
jgi:hypothetical protein